MSSPLFSVNPSGFNSLGFSFEEKFYFDKCMPMGFSKSCSYFKSFSTFLQWVLSQNSPQGGVIHYLDDFLFIGPAESHICSEMLGCFVNICDSFGIPLANEKTVGPTSVIEFLGITIDSVAMEFHLPMDKIIKMRSLIKKFLSKRRALLRDVQSLLGLFAFASRVIPVARIFSRRFALAIGGFKNPFSHISITRPIKEDLRVWDQFLINFNGQAVWQSEFVKDSEIRLFTDASGSVGFGAFLDGHWCAERWPDSWRSPEVSRNLVLLELFPVVVAITIWSNFFENKRVMLHTDNKGVFFAVNCLSSKSELVIKLLSFLVLQCMTFNIWLKAKHVPGITNEIADSLSRLQFRRFRELVPEPDQEGFSCPDFLWGLIWE